jgi:glutaredoxin
MANKLFDVETGLKIGDSYWFSGNGNIIASGTIIAGNISVTGATSITNLQYENTVVQYANNLSSPNVFITGGSLGVNTDGTVSEMANVYAQLGRFSSLSSPNVFITGGSVGVNPDGTVSEMANVYAQLGRFSSLSIANVMITSGNVTTLVATNFSSGNVLMTGDITQSATGTFSYNANTLPPKQYTDVMSVVFGS